MKMNVSSWFSGRAAGSWEDAYNRFVLWLTNPETWAQFATGLVQIIVILVLGRLVNGAIARIVERLIRDREKNAYRFNPRRIRTLGRLIGNGLTYTINFIIVMMILNQLGINLGPLLAGAGVVGLAVGFGAQSLVKDVITGFFIVFEDQFAVGDTVQISSYKGTVEEIGLRVTRIASWTGEVHIIPNGLITQVTNYSVNNSIAIVDIVLPYQSKVDRAISVLEEALDGLKQRDSNVIGKPQILGMQSMSQSELSLRIAAECRPDTHTEVQRELLAEAKKALDLHKVEISVQQ